MDIKLSIIIPVYKEENYIEECLNSVLQGIVSSDIPDNKYEVIVVSDGASDETIKKVSKYSDDFINFKLIEKEHRGAGPARNVGIEAANGEYISFVDADDRLSEGFLEKTTGLLDSKKDLYIFGIKRIEGEKEIYWTVADKVYDDIHSFADEYIKKGHLLVYSNCNKLYKSKIIKDHYIRFREDIIFGEDRIFNYDFITYAHNIITSSIIKHDYLKRSDFSQSNMYHKNYFDIVLNLHKERTKCFLNLKNDVTLDEIKDFTTRNLIDEISNTIDRFSTHIEGIENKELIDRLLFIEPDEMNDDIGIFIILGSNNCFYKVDKALEICSDRKDMIYVVSGGNLHKSGDVTEAEFMARYLKEKGISDEKIHIENHATNTLENFQNSYKIINDIKDKYKIGCKIGAITSDFHLKRTKLLVKKCFPKYIDDTYFFSATAPTVNRDTWYQSAFGKKIFYAELTKIMYDNFDMYLDCINS